jgi:hypothetical protein
MSWDGLIFQAPPGVRISDLPADFQSPPLGTTEEIGMVLRRLFPGQSHHPGQCSVTGDDFWLELNFGYPREQDIRTSIGVRCNAGSGMIPILNRVCEAFHARLFDNQIGDFADMSEDTAASMATFAAFRDRVTRARHETDPESAEGRGSEP